MPQQFNQIPFNQLILIGGDQGNLPAPITKSSDYTLTSTDCVVYVDTSASTVIITLPSATFGKCFLIKKIASENSVVITPQFGQTIDDNATVTILFKNTAVQLVGSITPSPTWHIF